LKILSCRVKSKNIKNAETDFGVSENEIEDFLESSELFQALGSTSYYQRNVFVPNELP
jgi:hypothetical protein